MNVEVLPIGENIPQARKMFREVFNRKEEPQKNRRLPGNKGRLPKAKEMAETDEGDESRPAQLAGSPSSYTRNDTI